MGKFAVGSIVTISFPYSDLKKQKVRPALILAKAEFDNFIICQITSKPYSSKTSVKITKDNFKQGYLPVVSYVRPDKLVTIEESLIRKSIANLNKQTTGKILMQVQGLFSPKQ